MNEKVIIKSCYAYNAKRMGAIAFAVFFVLDLIMLLVYSLIRWPPGSYRWYNQFSGIWETHYRTWSPVTIVDAFEELAVPAVILLALGIVCAVIISRFKSELTVTDKRVYGLGIFGKRVDLPLDSVTAIGSMSFFMGLSITTSSGSLKFFSIKNYKEIYVTLSTLLIERQEQKKEVQPVQVIQNQSGADELKKYKELLDSGVITQEEFDTKKKQLLGL